MRGESARHLIRELAAHFGGKVVEHSLGFLLNSRLGENKCQFETGSYSFTVQVHRLKFSAPNSSRILAAPIFICSGKLYERSYKGYWRSKAASDCAGVNVYWKTNPKEVVDEKPLVSFCSQFKSHLPAFKLDTEYRLVITHNSIKLRCFD